MIDRHRRLSGDHSREHHDAVTGREDGLAGAAAEIDPAMTRQPVLGRFVESASNRVSADAVPTATQQEITAKATPRRAPRNIVIP